jgi:ABC-type thiamin/hydroxymethylpyrimidine transport system permease subunit
VSGEEEPEPRTEHRVTKSSAWALFPVLFVSALWFWGKFLNCFGGSIDTVGAQMCRESSTIGLWILVPALAVLFLPRLVQMSLLERMRALWLALHTTVDIGYEWFYGWV